MIASNNAYVNSLRREIITKKVKLLLTLYRPLPTPPFYLVKPKLLALPPSPPKVSKNCTLSGALVTTVMFLVMVTGNLLHTP